MLVLPSSTTQAPQRTPLAPTTLRGALQDQAPIAMSPLSTPLALDRRTDCWGANTVPIPCSHAQRRTIPDVCTSFFSRPSSRSTRLGSTLPRLSSLPAASAGEAGQLERSCNGLSPASLRQEPAGRGRKGGMLPAAAQARDCMPSWGANASAVAPETRMRPLWRPCRSSWRYRVKGRRGNFGRGGSRLGNATPMLTPPAVHKPDPNSSRDPVPLGTALICKLQRV